MDFKKKVQSMTAREIIIAMVNALTRPPIINIDMGSFGHSLIKESSGFFGLFKRKKRICYGCAATNTICQISGKKFTFGNIKSEDTRAEFINSDVHFLSGFEIAIDQLRRGNIRDYNSYAKAIDIAEIIYSSDDRFPYLHDNYTNEDLEPYKQLANSQS